MSFPHELILTAAVYIAVTKDGAETLVTDKQAAVKGGLRVTYELAAAGVHRFEFSPSAEKACYAGFIQEVSEDDVAALRSLGVVQEPNQQNQ